MWPGIMGSPCPPRIPGSGWLFCLAVCVLGTVRAAADVPRRFPISDIKPGMKGVVYTIFEGDQVEKVDLEVIGILNNALGPKQDVILVKLLGDKAEKTGVAAGMSGSPVYFDGKLAGALSLKIGNFTKDAIGGVTPIASMFDVAKSSDVPAMPVKTSAGECYGAAAAAFRREAAAVGAGSGQFLIPIETPLITAGCIRRRWRNSRTNWRPGELRRWPAGTPRLRRRTRRSSPATWSEWTWCAAIFR